MICVILSENTLISKADNTIITVVHKAKLEKLPYINIIFISSTTLNVFKYREVFTKYIDIGVRVFMSNDVEKLKQIVTKECKDTYTPSNDENLRMMLTSLGLDMNIKEV